MQKYGVEYQGVDAAAPAESALRDAQARANFAIAVSVLKKQGKVVEVIGDRILAAADSVPKQIAGVTLGGKSAGVFSDPAIYDFKNYPAAPL